MPTHKQWLLVAFLQFIWSAGASSATGDTAPPSPNLNNVFNAPPVGALSGNHNLVVAVHGFKSDPTVWAANMVSSINSNVPSDTWDTWAFDWSQDAANSLSFTPTNVNIINAQLQGQYLAHMILTGDYQNIQLIGHSLGGRVIQTAATVLNQTPSHPTIQTTFLDPYTPYNWNLIYGTNATWSDEIVNTTDWLNTNAYLANAFDVDVTAALAPKSTFNEGHAWPYQWYQNTVSAYNPSAQTYAGLGFGLSLEEGAANWPAGNPARGTVDIMNQAGTAIASTTTTPSTVFRNQLNINPGGQAAVLAKSSDNVVLGDNLITMHTSNDMNEWVNLAFNPTAATNYIDFKFDFSTNEDGTLSVWLDNSLIYAALDSFALTNQWEDSGIITFDSISPGEHVLSYRLDSGPSDGGTTVQLEDINAGLIAAPEPASAILCTSALTLLLLSKRRSTPFHTFDDLTT